MHERSLALILKHPRIVDMRVMGHMQQIKYCQLLKEVRRYILDSAQSHRLAPSLSYKQGKNKSLLLDSLGRYDDQFYLCNMDINLF